MQDLIFLVSNREKPKYASRLCKVWIKRIVLLPSLLKILYHPLKYRYKGAAIGKLVVMGGAAIRGRATYLTVGNQTSLGKCRLELHDKLTIGSCVCINDGVRVLTASHYLDDPAWKHKKAPIIIDDYAWVATGAIILPGVKIGKGAVIGAGAVVSKDVEPYSIWIGNPAQPLQRQRTDNLTYSPVLMNAPFEAWVGPNLGS